MNQSEIITEGYVTTSELMRYLSLPKSTFELLVKQGMPVLRIGKSRRFKVSEVENWLINRSKDSNA